MKMKRVENQMIFTTEDAHDCNIIEFFVNKIQDSEVIKNRVKYDLRKMDEITTINADLKKELFKMKRSWVYKVWKFITDRW